MFSCLRAPERRILSVYSRRTRKLPNKREPRMMEVVLSLLTGLAVGALFALLKLPIPAPPTLAGVAGILGLFLGPLLVAWWTKS
jgi:XapX domain-containing protein